MDRNRARLLLLGSILLLLGAGQAGFPIRAAQWLAPEHRLQALSTRPNECAPIPSQPADRDAFEVGRAAFRSPLLLGGQAARAGLSCESCHSNGRRNEHFKFPGLSGSPGTADVTSSIMSSHRGNDIFDPRTIPDLAIPAKVSRDPSGFALEHFIRGLIVEEFDGAEPPPLVLDGLARYVRSIGPSCENAKEPIRLSAMLDDSRRATMAAEYAWRQKDPAAARLLVSGARSALGRINERYSAEGLAGDRKRLRAADLGLLAIEQAIDRRDGDIPQRLAGWRAGMASWDAALLRDERRSLFDKGLLARALDK